MSKKLQVQEEVSPNLIPMIDIMFLLLLFFMLGADMGQRELEEVILPKALAVQEVKETVGEKNENVVVNVYHAYDVDCPPYKAGEVCRAPKHWKIGIRGRDFTDLKKLEPYMMQEANLGRATPVTSLSKGEAVTPSERPVTIRADASAPFGQVQEVMNTCAKVGIYKVECGAARPPDAELPGAATTPAAK